MNPRYTNSLRGREKCQLINFAFGQVISDSDYSVLNPKCTISRFIPMNPSSLMSVDWGGGGVGGGVHGSSLSLSFSLSLSSTGAQDPNAFSHNCLPIRIGLINTRDFPSQYHQVCLKIQVSIMHMICLQVK